MARLQILPLPNPTGDIPGAQPFALVLDQVQDDLTPEQREQLAGDAETFRYRCAAAAILVTTQTVNIPAAVPEDDGTPYVTWGGDLLRGAHDSEG